MTLPATEVTIFNTSDSFRANPELLEPAFKQLRAEGVTVPLYYGLEAEDPSIGFVLVNWDSYEHHQEVMKAPFYAKLARGLTPAVAGPPQIYHVQFSAPAIALDMPVTEVVLLTLKSPHNRAAVVDVLSTIAQLTENLFVFGQTREDEGKYIAICGRESVEAHRQAVSNLKSQEMIKKLHSLANEDFAYSAKLKKFGERGDHMLRLV